MAQVKDAAAAEDVIDRMIAEQPLIKPAVESSRGVVASGHPLASAGRRARARARRQRRRRRHCRVVRARRRRTGCVEHRRRRSGDSVSQGHDRAGRHRIQGHDAEPRDHRQSEAVQRQRQPHGRRRSDGREHSGRRRRTGSCSTRNTAARKSPGPISSRRRSSWPTRASCSTRRCRRRSPKGASRSRRYPEAAKSLPAGRPRAEAGRAVRQQGLRRDASHAREGRRPVVLPRHDSAPDCGRHGGERRRSSRWRISRSTARSSASRSSGSYRGHLVYSVPPPVPTGLQIVETLQILDNYLPQAGRDLHDRRRLLSLRDRGLACPRRRRADRRPGAMAGRPRQSSRSAARARSLQAHRSEEGLHRAGRRRSGGAAGARRSSGGPVAPGPDRHDGVRGGRCARAT